MIANINYSVCIELVHRIDRLEGNMMSTNGNMKTISFGIRLPAQIAEEMVQESEQSGASRSDMIRSLWENRNEHVSRISNQSLGQDLSGFKTEMIESLRAEIQAGLTVPSLPPPPDLSPVLAAIENLTCRIGEMGSLPSRNTSEVPVDLSPLLARLDEIGGLLQSGPPSGETESDAHAISFLSLQMGEIQQGIERLSVQMDTVVRSGRNNGAGTPEIKDELIRLAEAAEHQSALTGEILRIGDSVREIRDCLQKNLPPAVAPGEKIPEKKFSQESRSHDPDPAAEKKAETRQWGWAIGIILVLFFGFIAWEMLGWYNGGDSGAPQMSQKPEKLPESSLLPGPNQTH